MNLFIRSKKNPILKPDKKHSWESRKVYNPGAIYQNGEYHLFYRAVGEDWISRIGYAASFDGECFKKSKRPAIAPRGKLETRGVEDPRLVKIGQKHFLTYTAYDNNSAKLSLATSKDLRRWRKHGPILPHWNLSKAGGFIVSWDKARSKERPEWSKAGAIFPEKINSKYWLLFGDSNLWLASSADGIKWRAINQPFLKPRSEKYFDSEHLEMGPPPIKTKHGWLALYHGIDKKITYRLGYLLLDLNNPTKIIKRSGQPIFEPRESYELAGLVDILPGGFAAMERMSERELTIFIKKAKQESRMPKVIFCCGAVLKNNLLRIYYGASDSVICVATAKLDDVLNSN